MHTKRRGDPPWSPWEAGDHRGSPLRGMLAWVGSPLRDVLAWVGSPLRDVLAWAGLAIATLGALWPLGLTNRVLAGVDAFTYFTPYWAYRMATLRAGHLPLWNPYLFLGVPFLANIQAAVLYPLHWPLIWLSPAQALIWSALLHVWLAAGFAYTFARRSLHLSRAAAWLTGLIFGLGGFTLARVENINQLNALAWLPALLWLLDETTRAHGWRGRIRWGSALAVALAMQLLAGHTQTAFINLVGLGLYALTKAVLAKSKSGRLDNAPRARRQKTSQSKAHPPHPLLTNLWPLVAVIPALLLSAAQLLPSIELNGLGLRTGGLPYRLAVSFSLRPRLLAQTFLPPFWGGLAEAFASEGYAEFAGWVGIVGLVLAAVGIASLWRRNTKPPTLYAVPRTAGHAARNTQHSALIILAAVGIFLALGAYNPFYYLLWRFMPGFDLFRAPARWLELYTLGMAGLAGVGLDAWLQGAGVQVSGSSVGPPPAKASTPVPRRAILRGVTRNHHNASRVRRLLYLFPCFLMVIALAVFQQWPRWQTLTGWTGVGLLVGMLLWAGRRWPKAARGALITLALAELWLGGRALPFTQATAPLALSLRNAPAALLAATASQPPAGRDRFLSMSDTRFDPGDLAELRALQADRLPPEAIERLVRATKQMEIIAPNLPLLLQLPAIDGYDGGMLPLERYIQLQTLFLPPDQLSPDGRLREQLREIPPNRLLDLTGVRYVITDKQNDLWADDVYYDLEQSAVLKPGATLDLDLASYPAFSATALGVVSYLEHAGGDGDPVAKITLTDAAGTSLQLVMDTPKDTAWAQNTQPHSPARIARQWPEWMGAGHDYLARLSLAVASQCQGVSCAFTPRRIRITAEPGPGNPLVIRGLTLIDERTGAHQSLTVSQRGDFRRIYSGDVKIYERVGAPGRAWLVRGVKPVADDTAALALLADPAFDPRATVTIAGDVTALPPSPVAPGEGVSIRAYDPERIVLRAEVSQPAMLVLADAFYPGWQATVDGQPAPILRANLMFRAVALDPGTHEVIFAYRPASWRWGVGISLGTLAALLVALAVAGGWG